MLILRIYSLDNKGLSESECLDIRTKTGADIVVHLTANNKLENIQYPLFEFEEINTENETKRILCELSQDELTRIVTEQSKR